MTVRSRPGAGAASPPVVILAGATGTGKTAVSLILARRLGAEVISADSRQIYQDLLLGTSKPAGRWVKDPGHPLKEYLDVEGVPHHLLDFLPPEEPFDAGRFAERASQALDALRAHGRRVLVVGGTGLYMRALVDGLAPLPRRDDVLRKALTALAERDGRASLHKELSRVDPEAAERIPANNLQRVVRALEVYLLTGRPISWWQKEKTVPSSHAFLWYGLRWRKAELDAVLAVRCRRMLAEGLVEETARLLARGVPRDAPCFQSLGYRLAADRLRGKITADGLDAAFLRETLQYAKRQLTWFRAEKRIHWIDVAAPFHPQDAAHAIESHLMEAAP